MSPSPANGPGDPRRMVPAIHHVCLVRPAPAALDSGIGPAAPAPQAPDTVVVGRRCHQCCAPPWPNGGLRRGGRCPGSAHGGADRRLLRRSRSRRTFTMRPASRTLRTTASAATNVQRPVPRGWSRNASTCGPRSSELPKTSVTSTWSEEQSSRGTYVPSMITSGPVQALSGRTG